MNENHYKKTARELSLESGQVAATAELLNGGATVPFIARYRKEATRGLDEVSIIAIRDRLEQLRQLEKRREASKLFQEQASMSSKVLKGKEQEGAKYKDYFNWQEVLSDAPSHRILAIRRGAKEGFLSFHILPGEREAIFVLESRFIKSSRPAAEQVREALRDSYKRLLAPSLEAEMRFQTKKRADRAAISVFVENLRELLMAPPLGEKRVLAIDPGLRTSSNPFQQFFGE